MAFAESSKMFPINPDVSLELLSRGIEQFLIQREGMVCQSFQTPDGYSIQTRKQDDWKKFAMLDNAMQVNVSIAGDYFSVSTGGAKWVDKAIAGGMGMILMWPLALPLLTFSSVGWWQTRQLPEKIMEFVQQFLMSSGQSIYIPPAYENPYQPQEDSFAQYNAQAQKYEPTPPYAPQAPGFRAPQYGTTQREQEKTCPVCNALVPATSKFCPECGNSLEAPKFICLACNAELDKEYKFCPDCGEKTGIE
ncbi:MAG: zinc ribbon domain-containing protein [Eubacteriaceae bacterium]|nr:zinc ribbon domain-containing protein [Eubacteriaceae bacterium]